MYDPELYSPFLKDEENNNEEDRVEDQNIAQQIRKGFIIKVYGIIIYQLIITFLIVYLAYIIPSFRAFLMWRPYLSIFSSFAVVLICLFLPLCYNDIYKKVPANYIILTIFTLGISIMVAAPVCFYSEKNVLLALLLTLITVVTLSVYSWKTKNDITYCGGILSVLLTLLIFGSLFLIFFQVTLLFIIVTICSLILFSVYLVYDTQLLSGKFGIKYSEDDYILAALNIYLDIINLFLEILRLIGIFGRNN